MNILTILERLDNLTDARIAKIHEELNITDWWKEKLTERDVKEMKDFLAVALLMGYETAWFIPGKKGHPNGMWAENKDGTERIWRSFTAEVNPRWAHHYIKGDKWTGTRLYDCLADMVINKSFTDCLGKYN